MLNDLILVGRLTKEIEIRSTDSGKKVGTLFLAVPRSFKNMEGVYETDFIDCTIWDSVARRTAEYCKKGDVIGIKGRIQTNLVEKEGEKKKFMNIVAEKVTFLSSRQKEQEKSNEDVEQDIEK